MARAEVDQHFPDFELGGVSTEGLRQRGPLVLLVWRTGCPTCRLALPLWDRLQASLGGLTILSVAQETAHDLDAFLQSSPNLGHLQHLPDPDLQISRMLEVEYVPTFWFIDSRGIVRETGAGWDRAKFENVARKAAALLGVPPVEVLEGEDAVPSFRPG